jgi:ornithine cyclodeaminase/alanine dehydrogenase-like protein (mu-crystallin family)
MDEARDFLKPVRSAPPALVLTRADIAELMTLADYRASAEEAFKALATGRAMVAAPMHIPAVDGGFHAKGAAFDTASGTAYAAVKVNGNFPRNPLRNGLPTIQGAIVLSDAHDGSLLAIMDSIEVTLRRTAAASALAARYLARRNATTLTLCGCGEQARVQVAALNDEFQLRHVYAWDIDPGAAAAFAGEMSAQLNLEVLCVKNLAAAAKSSDLIVTCTTSRSPFLDEVDVRTGTFIAAVGADSPDKSELTPRLMAQAKVVVDTLEQCLSMGDLHHAVAAGVMTAGDVHATLSELAVSQRPGRVDDDEITIFDSTGTAIQDAAAAVRIYERAKARRSGLACDFGRQTQSPARR